LARDEYAISAEVPFSQIHKLEIFKEKDKYYLNITSLNMKTIERRALSWYGFLHGTSNDNGIIGEFTADIRDYKKIAITGITSTKKGDPEQEMSANLAKSGGDIEGGNTQNVDWNNIPGLVLHLFHNAVQGDPELEPTKINLHFFGPHDQGASSGEGYCWWMVYDNPNANATDLNKKLPSGLVLGLKHNLNQRDDDRITVFGVDPADDNGPSEVGGIIKKNGGDLKGDWDWEWAATLATAPESALGGIHGSSAGEGFYWYETFNPDFKNWDEAEKNLPMGTVLGLKHSLVQSDKKVTWRGQQYDPIESYRNRISSPPTFTAKHGGDLGAPEGEGFFWFEKTTGPDFFQLKG
jgi:hypothetical protein